MAVDDDEAMAATMLPNDPALSPTVAADVDPALAPTLGGPTQGGGPVEPTALTREDPARYRREEELGRGGMGRVIVAFDEHLGREVAMKELLIQQGGGSSGAGVTVGVVTRFLREARITGQLEHPNIVPVHELGRRDDGTLYYTMKRIRGRSFGAVLKEARTLEDRLKLLPRFGDVCEALAYAHSRGVVHRDIKPDNVMVGEFGETLVVDWGLAKVRGQDDVRSRDIERRVNLLRDQGAASTIDGHAIGTPAYMSPEQARGDLEAIDERSDVWGLGAMLFEILTGRPPYEGENALSVLHKVLDDPAPRVRDVLKEAPPELAAIADRALLRDPSSRYPDARSLAHEMEAYEEGRQVHAYEYSALEQVRRFVGRNLAASIAALVIFVAVATAGLLSYQGYRSERDAREIAQTRRDEAIARQHAAEDEAVQTRVRLARALLEHAERSLDEGDPSAAAIYAAGALLHDPANPDSPEHTELGLRGDEEREAEVRVARSLSAYLEGEDARRFVFVRRIPGATRLGALSPNGRTLVFPAGPRLVLEPVTGGERRTIDVRASRVLGFLDDDRVVLNGEEPMVLRLSDGEHLAVLPEGVESFARHGDVYALALRDGAIVVYGADDYTERARFEASVAEPLIAGTDGGWWVAGAGRVSVWGLEGGEALATARLDSPVRALAPAPDGARAALALADPRIALLDAALPVPVSLPAEGSVADVGWLGESLLISAEGDDAVMVRSASTRHRLDTLHLPADPYHRLALSARRSLIVALPTADAGQLSAASVFHFERHRMRRMRPVSSSVHEVLVDPRRNRVLAATMRELLSLETTTRGLGETVTLAQIPRGNGLPARMAVSDDGAIVLSTDRGAVLLYEPGREEMRVIEEPSGGAPCPLPVSIAPNGQVIFAADADGRVRRYPRSGTRLLAPLDADDGVVCGLARTADGDAIASVSIQGTLRIWNARTARAERTLSQPELRYVDVAFAPDGEQLAIADDAGGVRIVRRADATEVRVVDAHDGPVRRVVVSQDGRYLATSGADGSVRYFTVEGQLVRVVRTNGGARSLAFSARSGFLYFGDTAHVVRLELTSSVDTRDPERLLDLAQRRAGVNLDGLALVPR